MFDFQEILIMFVITLLTALVALVAASKFYQRGILKFLSDPKFKKVLQEFIIDDELFSQVGELVFHKVSSGIYGFLGIDPKAKKGVKKAIQTDMMNMGGFGDIKKMFPKLAEKMEKNEGAAAMFMQMMMPAMMGQGKDQAGGMNPMAMLTNFAQQGNQQPQQPQQKQW